MTTKQIIQQIAKKHGVSPKEVKKDIKEAISIGIRSTNPQTQAIWNKMAPKGKEPSIDALLKFCVKEYIYLNK